MRAGPINAPTRKFLRAGLSVLLASPAAWAQTLNLPPRPADAFTGTQFINVILATPAPTDAFSDREHWIYAQVVSGNVPGWMRTLKPITVTAAGHTATYYVLPDYLAIGSDTDYFLTPMTPLLAQRLADRLGGTLPTRKMVNQIWTNAAVKLTPQPIPPSADMINVPVFAQHNDMVHLQRDTFTNAQPPGALVGGDKKDVVISTLVYSNLQVGVPKPVVIYGWHYTNGSPIQPLYNGHGETYADYSHGIRLVQQALTVDGNPNTVTNVLTSPTLAALLSDETTAPSFTIPLPRYTVPAWPPVILTAPRSQTVAAGQTVTFTTLAIDDPPLSYRWQHFGTNLPDATNASLVLSNVQPADAGLFALVASNSAGAVTSRVAVLRVNAGSRPVLFADDFDSDTSTHWNVVWGATNGVPDYTVDWAFDYRTTPYTFNGATALIPPAPNSPDGSTRAVRLTVNQNDTNAVIAAVNLYPRHRFFSGNYALKFDLWINYPGNAGGAGSTGSTQHAIFGLNHYGTNANWAAPAAAASDGLWFAVDGEGGESRDYRAYAGNPAGAPVDLTATLSASNNTAAIYQNLFPATRFETPGAPGKNWVEVEVRYTNNVVTWLMDGVVIGQRTNTSEFTGGTVMLGLMDTFNSIASPARDSFVLFDNVRVESLDPPPVGFQSIARLPDGSVSLVLTSAPGDAFTLENSTNLAAWQTLTTFSGGNGTTNFLDSNAPLFPRQFYRTRH
jgi:hypothetical protein